MRLHVKGVRDKSCAVYAELFPLGEVAAVFRAPVNPVGFPTATDSIIVFMAPRLAVARVACSPSPLSPLKEFVVLLQSQLLCDRLSPAAGVRRDRNAGAAKVDVLAVG